MSFAFVCKQNKSVFDWPNFNDYYARIHTLYILDQLETKLMILYMLEE